MPTLTLCLTVDGNPNKPDRWREPPDTDGCLMPRRAHLPVNFSRRLGSPGCCSRSTDRSPWSAFRRAAGGWWDDELLTLRRRLQHG
ncbi:hypothetical protein PoB_000308600 [Plakobranchus ocellatus]|uniref:Uncharacterized protein n=1 Tax=Plakobranchus ocellatus TaxID=259542 RepID=A0AAV3XG77_9GAST|nr:hypothetical protein PoB_000308600 [Plakobranchus ocellatus]